MKYFVVLLIAILILICFPLLAIWSINTLFPVLAIPYTFETWLAWVLLSGILRTFFYYENKR